MIDSYKHKGLRSKLVHELRAKNISNEEVLRAIGHVPRHLFMDSGFINFSYKDQAFPIGNGQTISQPYTVAFQSQLLDIKKYDKVLEIGTGSGYQAAILMEMGAKVFTIERQRQLFIRAQQILTRLNYNAHFVYGDGNLGLPTYGPFDKIIVTAGAPQIPQKLVDQLKIGGKMVIPVNNGANQIMTLVFKKDHDDILIEEHGSFLFVPLLEGTNK